MEWGARSSFSALHLRTTDVLKSRTAAECWLIRERFVAPIFGARPYSRIVTRHTIGPVLEKKPQAGGPMAQVDQVIPSWSSPIRINFRRQVGPPKAGVRSVQAVERVSTLN